MQPSLKKRLLVYSAALAVFFVLMTPRLADAQTALQITDLSVTLDEDTATFTWRTNIPTDGRIDLGTDVSYGIYFISGEAPSTEHRMTVGSLASEATYHYRITSRTSYLSVSSFDQIFKTGKIVDRTVPVIEQLRLVYVTGTTASIQWLTDEETSGTVFFGKTRQYTAQAGHGNRTKIHDVTIGGLSIAATYHAQVSVTDADGNTATSNDITFTTLLNGEPDKGALMITNIRPLTANDPGIRTDTAVISWATNKLSTSIVRYGTDIYIGQRAEPPMLRTFQHEITLKDLKPGVVYYFAVSSVDVFNQTAESTVHSFETMPLPIPVRAIANPITQPRVLGFTTIQYTQPNAFYRMKGGTAIYAIFMNKKYLLPGPTALIRYGVDMNQVREVSQSTLDALSFVALVRPASSQTVYHLYRRTGGRILKLAIPSSAVFSSYPRNKWGDIMTIDAADLNGVQNAALIKVKGSPAVYLVEKNTKRIFTSAAAFERRGYRYQDIVEVSKIHLDSYANRDPLL